MTLMSILNGFGKRLDARKATVDFDRAVERVGGEDKLQEVFTKTNAFTVSKQAVIVGEIAAGIPVEKVKSGNRHDWYKHAEAERIRTAISEKDRLSILKSNRVFFVHDQPIYLAGHVIRPPGHNSWDF